MSPSNTNSNKPVKNATKPDSMRTSAVEYDVTGHDAAIDSPHRKRLPPLLRQAWYSLNQAFRRRINHLHVTPDQFTILRWLVECDPDWPTQRELGDMMASDPNTITSLVRRMENVQFLERHQDAKDRRANRIRITPTGKKIYNKARRIAIDLQAEVLEALPPTDRDSFFEQLEIVANACRETLDGKA
jgi:DNA-binding MarR family transcriptional regulator